MAPSRQCPVPTVPLWRQLGPGCLLAASALGRARCVGMPLCLLCHPELFTSLILSSTSPPIHYSPLHPFVHCMPFGFHILVGFGSVRPAQCAEMRPISPGMQDAHPSHSYCRAPPSCNMMMGVRMCTRECVSVCVRVRTCVRMCACACMCGVQVWRHRAYRSCAVPLVHRCYCQLATAMTCALHVMADQAHYRFQCCCQVVELPTRPDGARCASVQEAAQSRLLVMSSGFFG